MGNLTATRFNGSLLRRRIWQRFQQIPLNYRHLLLWLPLLTLSLALPAYYLKARVGSAHLEDVDREAMQVLQRAQQGWQQQSAALSGNNKVPARHWQLGSAAIATLKLPRNFALDYLPPQGKAGQAPERTLSRRGTTIIYRAKLPLLADASCQACHKQQFPSGALVCWLQLQAPLDSASWRDVAPYLVPVGLALAPLLLGVYLVQRLLCSSVLAPIRQITHYAEQLSNGEYVQSPAVEGEGEFSLLAEKLASMADNILLGNRQVIKSLAVALECRDPYTAGHVERVSIYALAVGERLGLNQNQLMQLDVAATLHDIGKIGVDDAILRKQAPLDPDERRKMEAHAEIGAGIIPMNSPLAFAIPGVLYHHERYDGTGYPRGLAGRSIPVLARILAVVDTYDAMTTDRPYRKGMQKKEAIAEILRMEGKQFDPEVVAAFIDASPSFEYRLSVADALADNGISDRSSARRLQ